jgi:hypothetical protein
VQNALLTLPDNTGRVQATRNDNGQFVKGVSGNPSGRPCGSLNKTTLAAQSLLDGQAEVLVQKLIDLALDGDTTALRLALERIIPPRKDNYVTIDLPQIQGAHDIVEAISVITKAVSTGGILPSEGHTLAAIIEHLRRSIETSELQQKLAHLESLLNARISNNGKGN